jgi:hypothetical protein
VASAGAATLDTGSIGASSVAIANGSGYGTVASAKRVTGPGAASGRFPSIIGGRGFPRIATFLLSGHRCHARIHRLRMVLTLLPTLLVQLWREQHPDGVE